MSHQQIKEDIKNNNIKSIYVLYGEESYLVEESVKKLKQHLVTEDFESLNFLTIEGKEIIVDKLIDACETLPFMADKKLVYVKNFDALQGKKKSLTETEEALLINYIANVPETTCLVFYGLTSVDSRKKLLKEMSKHGSVLNFEKLKENELNKWITGRFKKLNKVIEQKEVIFMMNYIDYLGKNAQQNLFDVDNEIEKIASFMGDEKTVLQKHIEGVSVFKFQNDIFKLLDAIGNRNLSEALQRLNHILDDGEATIRLMVTLSNQITNILSAKLLLEEGYTPKMIATKLGLHPFVAGKAASQSSGYTVNRLRELLNHFLKMDVMIKTGKINDRIALELLIVEICNRR